MSIEIHVTCDVCQEATELSGTYVECARCSLEDQHLYTEAMDALAVLYRLTFRAHSGQRRCDCELCLERNKAMLVLQKAGRL